VTVSTALYFSVIPDGMFASICTYIILVWSLRKTDHFEDREYGG